MIETNYKNYFLALNHSKLLLPVLKSSSTSGARDNIWKIEIEEDNIDKTDIVQNEKIIKIKNSYQQIQLTIPDFVNHNSIRAKKIGNLLCIQATLI